MLRGVIIARFDPVDVGKFHHLQRAAVLDQEALGFGRYLQALLGARHHAGEARVVERFQDVVERAHLERAQRKLMVGGDETTANAGAGPHCSSMAKPSHSGMSTSRKTRSGASAWIGLRHTPPRHCAASAMPRVRHGGGQGHGALLHLARPQLLLLHAGAPASLRRAPGAVSGRLNRTAGLRGHQRRVGRRILRVVRRERFEQHAILVDDGAICFL